LWKTRKSEKKKCDIGTLSQKDKQNIEVHHLLIDFQAPYDIARKKEIWSEMHKLGFPPQKIVRLGRISNSEIYAKVKIGKHLSCEFKVNKVPRQGDAIDPLLFNVVLKIAITIFTVEKQTTIFEKYKGVSKISMTGLVKRSLLTLDVKFLHHLQSTHLLHEYSGPSISAMPGSIPGNPFLELCQVPTVIPLESLQWCRMFDPSSKASAWGRGKSHREPDRVSMGDGGSLSCCSWPKTAKF